MLKTEIRMTLSNNYICLKKLTLRHKDSFFATFDNSEISRFSMIPYPLRLSWVKNYIRKSMEKFELNEKYSWAIFQKHQDQFVGVAVLKNINHENKSAQIGYSIGQNFWNKGYTKMAVKLVLNYAFKDINLNRVEIRIDCNDEKSIKLLDDLNCICEGRLRSSIYRKGEFHDLLLYSILRNEFIKD
jgi:[ribosomal protein S5]-alanine N-acetyltransferase